ncbi:MAG: exopolysaccharide transport family protein [Pseudomonadota bacterium]
MSNRARLRDIRQQMSQSDNPYYSAQQPPPAGPGFAADPHAGGASAVDLSAVFKGMWHRKKLMGTIIFCVVAAAVLFVATATPKFTATAKVLLEAPTTSYRDPDLGPNQVRGARAVSDQDVYSQVEVIESRDLAARVAKTLNLSARSEFDPRSTNIGPVKAMLIGLGLSSDPRLQTNEQRVLDKFADKLKAFPVVKSKVIQVEFSSKRPRTAAEVANTLAELYVTSTREVQLDDTRRASGWLSEQIAQLRNEVSRSEAAVEEYRARAGLVQGRSESTTLAQDELSELNRQIALAAAGRAEAVAKAEAIRKLLKERGTVAASNDVTASNLIQRLREQEIALTRRLADLSTTYLSNHPRILSVRQEINDVRREIRVEALKIVEGLEQQAKVASARESSLRASMNELKTTASVNKQDEVKLRALEREAKANREQLEALLKRLSDASARQDIYAQPARARIISRAAVPSQPSFPKKGPILMIATGGAIAIALLAAFLVEAINVGGASGVSARPHGGHPPSPQPTAPPPQPQSPAPGRGGLFAKLKGAMKTSGPGEPAHASAAYAPHAYPQQPYVPQAPVAAAYPAPPQPTAPVYAPPPHAAPAPEAPNPAWSQPPQATPPASAAAAPARQPANPFAVDQSVVGATPPPPPKPSPPPLAEVVAPAPVAPAPQARPQAPVSAAPEPTPQPHPMPQPPAPREPAPILANIADMSNDLEGLPYQVIVDPSSPFSSSVFLAARSIAERLGELSNIRLFVAPTHEPTAGVIMSASLARAFSTFGLKTIVVDATMSGGELTAAFGVHDGPGLSEFLRGSSAFSDCIVRDGASSTHVMTSGANSSEARELAAGNRIDVTLAALSHAYDVVIMSAANLTSNPWALSIAEKTDMALLVTPAEAHDGVAAQFAETMKSAMSKDVCFVLAHAPQRHAYVA